MTIEELEIWKALTDAELVEAVAREVLGIKAVHMHGNLPIAYKKQLWHVDHMYEYTDPWRPFRDLNDLFMVLEKHDKWEIVRTAVYTVNIWIAPGEIKQASSIFLPRAVLEAALAAERSEK